MNQEEIKKVALDLDKDIESIQKSLKKLKEDIGNIETGDTNGPYWSGDHAYQTVRAALLQIEHDTALLKDLENKVGYIHTLIK